MVEAKSRADLRKLARILREHLRLDDVSLQLMGHFLSNLTRILTRKNCKKGIKFTKFYDLNKKQKPLKRIV